LPTKFAIQAGILLRLFDESVQAWELGWEREQGGSEEGLEELMRGWRGETVAGDHWIPAFQEADVLV